MNKEIKSAEEYHAQFVPAMEGKKALQMISEVCHNSIRCSYHKLEEGIKKIIEITDTYLSAEQPDVGAVEIAKGLAEWSLKYPRSVTYSSSQKQMDIELIALEEKAKEYLHQLQQK